VDGKPEQDSPNPELKYPRFNHDMEIHACIPTDNRRIWPDRRHPILRLSQVVEKQQQLVIASEALPAGRQGSNLKPSKNA
jgi:hypothetical protein